MFCDQDDIWLPTKIERTLLAMKNAEDNGDTPVLIHTDLNVVDSNLNVISPSFFGFNHLNQSDITLPKLLVQNYVTGCTVMINRAFKNICGDISDKCIMHDWWLALVAVLFGKLVCLEEATILYRHHQDNQVGAKASYGLSLVKQKLASIELVRKNYNATYVQAQALIESYGNVLKKEQREMLELYCEIKNMSKLKKIYTVNKYGFKKGAFLRALGQYILL